MNRCPLKDRILRTIIIEMTTKKNGSGKERRMAVMNRQKIDGLIEKLLHVTCCVTKNDTDDERYKELKSIYELTKEIENLEETFESKTEIESNRKDKIKPFMRWMKDNGAIIKGSDSEDGSIDSVEIKDFGEQGFGMSTTRSISYGELVFEIPRNVMLSSESPILLNHDGNVRLAVGETDTLGPLRKAILDIIQNDKIASKMTNVALALRLLLELNKVEASSTTEQINTMKESFFKPYINILPDTYSTVLYFEYHHFELLQGMPLLDECILQLKCVARQFSYFYRKMPKNVRPFFTYTKYKWAVSTVMTRQNAIPTGINQRTISTLIPLWDMCNHSSLATSAKPEQNSGNEKTCRSSVTTDYVNNKLMCYSNSNFKEDQPFTIQYAQSSSKRSHTDFFLHNAFVLTPNEFNADSFKYKIEITLQGNGKHVELKRDVLQALLHLKKPPSCMQFEMSVNNTKNEREVKPIELLTFIKVVVCQDEVELESMLKEATTTDAVKNSLPAKEDFLDLNIDVYKFLMLRCKILLKFSEKVKNPSENDSSLSLMCHGMRKIDEMILEDVIKVCQSKIDESTSL